MKVLSSIRRVLKGKFDRFNNERLKRNLLNALPFWLGAFLSGVISVAYAKLFAGAESLSMRIFTKDAWWFILLTPLCFMLSWWLVKRFAPYARGSGIPQVSAAIELSNPRHSRMINPLLSIRVILVKVFSSLILVFGGGAIGREGPTIQISASIFKKINEMLPAWYPRISKQNMIVTGAAAGLASAFNTPLGGIVFAIEELTKTHFSFFKSALLTGVIIAGLTALSISGPYLYLGYPSLNGLTSWIVFPVILVALMTGVAGTVMNLLIQYLLKKRDLLKGLFRNLGYLLLLGIFVALIAILVDHNIFGSGKDLMLTTLFTNQKQLPWYMPVLRVFGPVLSFSSGASGGIFAPSLAAGASIGSAASALFHLSDTSTNLVILCGMTGLLTSITRSPFTSSILVLEMTNSHNVIFYIMLTGLVSNLISNMISKHSLYDVLKNRYIGELHKAEAPAPSVAGT
jgi:H+/Cl- antiporter ClcA